jgi:hypothetical protein
MVAMAVLDACPKSSDGRVGIGIVETVGNAASSSGMRDDTCDSVEVGGKLISLDAGMRIGFFRITGTGGRPI